jgi:Acyl-CoA dehydrogenase, C-terminal domain
VQIFGGCGFSEEYPMSRSYRDSRINRIFEGTNEINRLLAVDMLLKKAMKGKIDLMSPAMAVQKELMSIPDFSEAAEGYMVEENKLIANFKKAILLVAGAAVQKLMMQLDKEQEVLMNIADMMIGTFIAESLLLRVEKMKAAGKENIEVYENIVRVYINETADLLFSKGKNSINGFAEGDELRMIMLGLKRFTKTQSYNTIAARRAIAKVLIDAGKYNL